jgi:hypothetical protein
MIITLILVSLLVLATLIYYQFFLKPKQLKEYYRKSFSSAYKVYDYPFTPLNASEFTTMKKDEKKNDDCYHTHKKVLSEFDIAISNVADKV